MVKIKAKKVKEPKKIKVEKVKLPEVEEETPIEEVKVEIEEVKEEIPDIDKELEKVEEKMEMIGKVRSPVFQKSSFIKTKAYNSPVPLYEIPEDIRKYLINMWFGTNVYEKGEERLIRHNADMEMIEKLKKFISEHYL